MSKLTSQKILDFIEYISKKPPAYTDCIKQLKYDFKDFTGVTSISSGLYASVYPMEGNRVLRVFDSDDGWLVWYKFIKTCGHTLSEETQKLLPAIYNTYTLGKHEYTTFLAVELEKLYEFDMYKDIQANIVFSMLDSSTSSSGYSKEECYTVEELEESVNELIAHPACPYFTDVHAGNIMRRDNGEPVITDPIGGSDVDNGVVQFFTKTSRRAPRAAKAA